jgi:hypothetical protein
MAGIQAAQLLAPEHAALTEPLRAAMWRATTASRLSAAA